MSEPAAPVEIPHRALFKAGEVCELLKLQPYVLRSWEAEFPDLGVTKTVGAPRVYRRADVEQVVRIRHLLLVEGLTLAGARRRIDEEATPVAADEPEMDALLGRNARERLTEIKRGLRSLLALLGGEAGASEFTLAAPELPTRRLRRPLGTPSTLAKTTRRMSSPRPVASPPPSPRRKGSA
jgi:DNA-binding transcriptional MerR regulator